MFFRVEQRVELPYFCFRKIHVLQQEGETYLDWLKKSCVFCDSHEVFHDLSLMAKQSLDICAELFEKYTERVMLHGDLYHDNLLRRANGCYTAIDPKGVIGPEIMDLAWFLRNEEDMSDDPAHIEKVISWVSQACGYPEVDLRKALFMEAVLANVWCVEDGMPVKDR